MISGEGSIVSALLLFYCQISNLGQVVTMKKDCRQTFFSMTIYYMENYQYHKIRDSMKLVGWEVGGISGESVSKNVCNCREGRIMIEDTCIISVRYYRVYMLKIPSLGLFPAALP